MKFKGLGDKLSKAWERAADKVEDVKDSVKNMDGWAGELQVKALKDKIAVAATSWDAIFVDEMLAGQGTQDGVLPTGATLLKGIKASLAKSLVKLRIEADKQMIVDTIAALDKALYADKKSPSYLAEVYTSVNEAMKNMVEIEAAPKILEAMDKQDCRADFENLVASYDFETRCANVLSRANYKGLITLAGSDEARETLYLRDNQQETINALMDIEGSEAVQAGNYVLDEILVKRAELIISHLEDETNLSKFNDLVGDYNMSVNLPKDAMAKHYGGQLWGATEEYTGKMLGAAGKGYSWLKGLKK